MTRSSLCMINHALKYCQPVKYTDFSELHLNGQIIARGGYNMFFDPFRALLNLSDFDEISLSDIMVYGGVTCIKYRKDSDPLFILDNYKLLSFVVWIESLSKLNKWQAKRFLK